MEEKLDGDGVLSGEETGTETVGIPCITWDIGGLGQIPEYRESDRGSIVTTPLKLARLLLETSTYSPGRTTCDLSFRTTTGSTLRILELDLLGCFPAP